MGLNYAIDNYIMLCYMAEAKANGSETYQIIIYVEQMEINKQRCSCKDTGKYTL